MADFKKHEFSVKGRLYRFTGKLLEDVTSYHPSGLFKVQSIYELYKPTDVYIVVERMGRSCTSVSSPMSEHNLQMYYPELAERIGKAKVIDLDFEASFKYGEDTDG